MFYYYERRAVSTTEKQDVMSRYSFNDYPKELQKKGHPIRALQVVLVTKQGLKQLIARQY